MRLPTFDYQAPSSLNDALKILDNHGPAAAILAGGTDLVPRLRQRLVKADLVLSLKNLPKLKEIALEGINLKIGAAASLGDVINHPDVKTNLPGLAEALKSIGARGIQHFTGTIGGNLLMQVRCIYYNQSEFWRSGRDHCFKNGGQVCHAVAESKECTAANQSDGAIMLTALSAQAVVQSLSGERVVPLAELFTGQGEHPFSLSEGELLTGIRVLLPPPGAGASYRKLRWRTSVDFPNGLGPRPW